MSSGISTGIDMLFASVIMLFALVFAMMSSSIISSNSFDALTRINEQSIAIRVIESLCLSPGIPADWEKNINMTKRLGLALTDGALYVLSKRKVEIFFRNFTMGQISSLLGLPNETYILKFMLKPIFSTESDILELECDEIEGGFTSSRLVVIDGSLFIFRVYVKKVS
ncbi:MAG: hypothetical protein NDF54_09305 [archaeon GB-1867-035]|nr:hypothetical protein [Candidatus Culexmicrobium profundum]